MTTISAKIIKDSISPLGTRLVTLHLRYPRFIHAEFMTHRVFSRNARSSRAVPVAKMIEEVKNDPAIPIHWGRNQPGMQAAEECNEKVHLDWEEVSTGIGELPDQRVMSREEAWLWARDKAVEAAEAFMKAGYHKQVANRLLEPFMHIDTLVSSTDWANWNHLRDHEDAEPHIQKLAREIKAAMTNSKPTELDYGQWHLPYIEDGEFDNLEIAQKVSVARCARISYTPFDGNGSVEAELERYTRLVGSDPLHASPAEHQAKPDCGEQTDVSFRWLNPHLQGNFTGWIQYRKLLPNEAKSD